MHQKHQNPFSPGESRRGGGTSQGRRCSLVLTDLKLHLNRKLHLRGHREEAQLCASALMLDQVHFVKISNARVKELIHFIMP